MNNEQLKEEWLTYSFGKELLSHPRTGEFINIPDFWLSKIDLIRSQYEEQIKELEEIIKDRDSTIRDLVNQ
jgi:hypothetical protein